MSKHPHVLVTNITPIIASLTVPYVLREDADNNLKIILSNIFTFMYRLGLENSNLLVDTVINSLNKSISKENKKEVKAFIKTLVYNILPLRFTEIVYNIERPITLSIMHFLNRRQYILTSNIRD